MIIYFLIQPFQKMSFLIIFSFNNLIIWLSFQLNKIMNNFIGKPNFLDPDIHSRFWTQN